MLLISRDGSQKLYLQLYEILKKKIESNEWIVGAMIPTEEELCKLFEVSRATVRTAVLELVRQGYLKRHQGKGTFVFQNSILRGLSMQVKFSEFFLEEDEAMETAVLATTVMMPIDDLDIKLDISKDRHIIYIKRLRSNSGKPVLLQESFIPHHICPFVLEEDIERTSLVDLLEKKFGIKLTKVRNYIELTRLNADEARLLEFPEGSPAILLHQHINSADTPVIYSRSIKRNDASPFFIQLLRQSG
jgi:DNA-binding GntR family transcriptional regulator